MRPKQQRASIDFRLLPDGPADPKLQQENEKGTADETKITDQKTTNLKNSVPRMQLKSNR